MSIRNYGELKTAVTRYLKRPDLADLYADWVDFASSRIDQDLRLPEQEYRTISVANAQYLSLPLDYIELRNIQVAAQGGALPLRYMTPEQLDNFSRFDQQQPIKYYTIVNGQLELIPAPAADSTTEIELFYYAKLPVPDQDADTNKVLTAFPQLYLYAMMIEAMPFMEHQEGQASWDSMYTDLAKLLNTRAQSGRFGANSLHMRAV